MTLALLILGAALAIFAISVATGKLLKHRSESYPHADRPRVGIDEPEEWDWPKRKAS